MPLLHYLYTLTMANGTGVLCVMVKILDQFQLSSAGGNGIAYSLELE